MSEQEINLKEWLDFRLQKIFYREDISKFCRINTNTKNNYCVSIFTENHQYDIYCNQNYLGCTSFVRKSVTGRKDFYLSNDLSDGDLTDETFEMIKNSIIRVESIPLNIELEIRKLL
jgi:hypothetical protein